MIVADPAGVTRAHGGRTIFAGVTWAVAEGARIGLIGAKGTGKSTLLRTIAGVEPPDGGTVTPARGVRVAYLEQEQTPRADRTVLEELLAARPDLAAIEDGLAGVARLLADPAAGRDLAAWGRSSPSNRRSSTGDERPAPVLVVPGPIDA